MIWWVVWREFFSLYIPNIVPVHTYSPWKDPQTASTSRSNQRIITSRWHSHLKDDCSYLFLFSSNPSRAKRFFTEALLNNHFSWPVILALNDANKGPVVAEALMTKSPEAIERAIEVIQCEGIQSTCRQEFVIIERTVKDLMGIWRRKQEYKSREWRMWGKVINCTYS